METKGVGLKIVLEVEFDFLAGGAYFAIAHVWKHLQFRLHTLHQGRLALENSSGALNLSFVSSEALFLDFQY